MDPLSISASIAGLLAVTGTIISTLEGFTSNVKNAPQSALSALFAVKDMKLALASVEKLLSSLSSLERTRKEMIQIDHLVIAITQSVVTLVELESLVRPPGLNVAKSGKQSIQKHKISEPRLISTSCAVDAVDLPPSASLHNNLNEVNDLWPLRLSAWERLKWVWKEADVSRTIKRLEGHKSSISLILNILQW
jgi:hypothetical protein